MAIVSIKQAPSSSRAHEQHYRRIIRCCERKRSLSLCGPVSLAASGTRTRSFGGVGAHSSKQHGKAGDGGVVGGFSFQVDGRKQDVLPALLLRKTEENYSYI